MRAVCALALALSLLNAGCSTSGPVSLLDVPFYQQDPNQCGAAALAMVLAYHGHPADIRALESEIFIPALRGTIPALMVDSAHHRGLFGQAVQATYSELTAAVAHGEPPIVLLAPGDPHDVGHFLVITGVKDSGSALRTHGPTAPNIWWTRDAFLARWEPADRLAVFLKPSPAAAEPPPSTPPPL